MVKFSKFIVSFIIAINLIFTIAVLYIFLVTGAEPVALIAAWFAFTTGELWFLAGIEKSKIRKEACYAKGLDGTIEK